MARYRTIVADPPWVVQAGPAHFRTFKATRDPDPRYLPASRPLAFDGMSVDDIAALPVGELAERDAHLYLWAINAYLEATYTVARAWGFRPVQLLTWAKTPRGLGLGGTYTSTTEFVLFCRRGSLKARQRMNTSWFNWKRPELETGPMHSRKPEHFLDMVEQVSPPPYVELFARRHRLGWDVWGDESANTAELASG